MLVVLCQISRSANLLAIDGLVSIFCYSCQRLALIAGTSNFWRPEESDPSQDETASRVISLSGI
jgi:hypothetical protein